MARRSYSSLTRDGFPASLGMNGGLQVAELILHRLHPLPFFDKLLFELLTALLKDLVGI
ncbi:MAG TPA: hypothetical protein VMA09_03890 [Candidatus Binataceae bacterium]|nr:hypothetical protein [Candidatus Binataceae bacterium]